MGSQNEYRAHTKNVGLTAPHNLAAIGLVGLCALVWLTNRLASIARTHLRLHRARVARLELERDDARQPRKRTSSASLRGHHRKKSSIEGVPALALSPPVRLESPSPVVRRKRDKRAKVSPSPSPVASSSTSIIESIPVPPSPSPLPPPKPLVSSRSIAVQTSPMPSPSPPKVRKTDMAVQSSTLFVTPSRSSRNHRRSYSTTTAERSARNPYTMTFGLREEDVNDGEDERDDEDDEGFLSVGPESFLPIMDAESPLIRRRSAAAKLPSKCGSPSPRHPITPSNPILGQTSRDPSCSSGRSASYSVSSSTQMSSTTSSSALDVDSVSRRSSEATTISVGDEGDKTTPVAEADAPQSPVLLTVPGAKEVDYVTPPNSQPRKGRKTSQHNHSKQSPSIPQSVYWTLDPHGDSQPTLDHFAASSKSTPDVARESKPRMPSPPPSVSSLDAQSSSSRLSRRPPVPNGRQSHQEQLPPHHHQPPPSLPPPSYLLSPPNSPHVMPSGPSNYRQPNLVMPPHSPILAHQMAARFAGNINLQILANQQFMALNNVALDQQGPPPGPHFAAGPPPYPNMDFGTYPNACMPPHHFQPPPPPPPHPPPPRGQSRPNSYQSQTASPRMTNSSSAGDDGAELERINEQLGQLKAQVKRAEVENERKGKELEIARWRLECVEVERRAEEQQTQEAISLLVEENKRIVARLNASEVKTANDGDEPVEGADVLGEGSALNARVSKSPALASLDLSFLNRSYAGVSDYLSPSPHDRAYFTSPTTSSPTMSSRRRHRSRRNRPNRNRVNEAASPGEVGEDEDLIVLLTATSTPPLKSRDASTERDLLPVPVGLGLDWSDDGSSVNGSAVDEDEGTYAGSVPTQFARALPRQASLSSPDRAFGVRVQPATPEAAVFKNVRS